MIRLAAFLCGALFGLGLVVSDMANPARVLAFLDVSDAWDPSLALVMLGALIPSGAAYLRIRARRTPLLAESLHIPTQRIIDRHLVIGSAIFGLGWGLAGVCPGPAIALLGTGQPFAIIFTTAMIAGVILHGLIHHPTAPTGQP